MTYKTKGTCSSQIDFDLKDGKVYNVRFTGGCNGNLKGIGALVEGQDARDVITTSNSQVDVPEILRALPILQKEWMQMK